MSALYDFHTHLNSDQLYPDRKAHLQDFVDAGGVGLVNIGVGQERNKRTIEILKNNTTECKIGATIGLHPGEIGYNHTILTSHDIDAEIGSLETLYKENKEYIWAIGEIGIDAHRDRDDEIKALQIELFEKQCQLAYTRKLPVVIHSRDNFELTLEILEKYADLKIYLHCRGYTPEHIQQAYEKLPHLWIGFCGNLTYPKATELRESFQKCLDLEVAIVLETDAPYLAPQAIRGQQNTPASLKHLYDRVAEKYGNEVIHKQSDNFQALYTK